ncbi:Aldo-keto reductase AKR2E4 [Eumeta japonica]|uniref:Aldo-keto reductase AKR2E4 n=1 Tax=Eumeta variegata TaxID=151549 RepID=A0A4C1ZEW1_EUMVA|nr:Aldo-keto reductase AKR2E4 [Eumeta japonica]
MAAQRIEVPNLVLNDGRKMPAIALGTYLGFDKVLQEFICNKGIVTSKDKELKKAVEYAIDVGYRHVDTAAVYATEAEVGEAIRAKVSNGTITREDIFVTTKLWNTHHERAKVIEAARESLKNLGLDYIDLYLMHWPIGLNYYVMLNDDDTDRYSYKTALSSRFCHKTHTVALHKKHSVASLGSTLHHGRAVVWPVWLQYEGGPGRSWDWKGIIHYELLPQGKTINSDLYCQNLMRFKQEAEKKRPEAINRKGVVFHHDNARPNTSLTTQQIFREWDDNTESPVDYLETWRGMEDVQRLGLARSVGLSNFNRSQLARVLDEAEVKPAALQIEVHPNLVQRELVEVAQNRGLLVMGYSPLGFLASRMGAEHVVPDSNDPILNEIAKKYGKTTYQVVLRWQVDRRIVPIPKSTNEGRLLQNIDIFDFELTEDEVAKIGTSYERRRIVLPSFWQDHPHYPFEKIDKPIPNPFVKNV